MLSYQRAGQDRRRTAYIVDTSKVILVDLAVLLHEEPGRTELEDCSKPLEGFQDLVSNFKRPTRRREG